MMRIALVVVTLGSILVACGGGKAPTRVTAQGLPRDYMQRGNALSEQRRFRQAVAEYKKALEIKPDYVQCRHNLGLAYNSLASYEAAKRQFRKCLQLNEDYLPPYAGLCESFYLQRNYSAAIKQATEAIDANESYAEAYFWRGVSHIAAGRGSDGEEDLRHATDLNNRYAAAHFELGKLYLGNRLFSKADRRFEAALDAEYDEIDCFMMMGISKKEQSRWDAAAALFKGIIRRNQKHAEARTHLGYVYLARGALARDRGNDTVFRKEMRLALNEFNAALGVVRSDQTGIREEAMQGKLEAEKQLSSPKK